MKQKIIAAVCSDKGCSRANNEDNFQLNGFYMKLDEMDQGCNRLIESTDDVQMFAVCDGMGGGISGEQASYTAVREMEILRQGISEKTDIHKTIQKNIAQINKEVYKIADGKAGSTVAILCLRKGRATTAYLGDSRVYLLRKGRLHQLTHDHTEAQRLINLGVLSKGEAAGHPSNNVLTRYLGMRTEGFELEPGFADTIRCKNNDVFLLCSDGLSKGVTYERIIELLQLPPEQASKVLVKESINGGSKDNITVIVIKIDTRRRFSVLL